MLQLVSPSFTLCVEKLFFYADRQTRGRQCRNADEKPGLDVGMDKFRQFLGLGDQKIERNIDPGFWLPLRKISLSSSPFLRLTPHFLLHLSMVEVEARRDNSTHGLIQINQIEPAQFLRLPEVGSDLSNAR